jgi:hypothetical protein
MTRKASHIAWVAEAVAAHQRRCGTDDVTLHAKMAPDNGVCVTLRALVFGVAHFTVLETSGWPRIGV